MLDGVGETIKICLMAWGLLNTAPFSLLFAMMLSYLGVLAYIGFFTTVFYATICLYVIHEREKRGPASEGRQVFDDEKFDDNLSHIEDLKECREIEEALQEEKKKNTLDFHAQ